MLLKRHRVRVAAVLAGTAACIGLLVGNDELTPGLVVVSIVVGLLTCVPILLVEGTLRGLIDRIVDPRGGGDRQKEEPSPDALTATESPTPEALSTFRGRQDELEELIKRHSQERELRDRVDEQPKPAGPVLLLVHGKPGVGKSALANELARQLAPQYPHGVYSVNFGTGGEPAPPAEILKRFLLKLGRSEWDIPVEATERAKLLRSLTTGRRILFLFDAARHHDQVRQVLPTDPGCAVIVTSRRDLSAALNAPSPAHAPLVVPPLEEALEMFAARARVDWMTQCEQAIETVYLCGNLPIAIRSAAERVAHDGTELRHVADLLRPGRSRLTGLERAGRDVRERFLSEYRRLSSQQKRALCLLTLVQAPTFVPWVLTPLLKVEPYEAENIMASLGAAQLLDNAGMDQATGLARYQFNPLIKLFAITKLSEHLEWTDDARARMETSYAEFVGCVLGKLDPTYQHEHASAGVHALAHVVQHVADHPEENVRVEYHNLVRLATLAYDQGQYGLCWRVTAMLRGCVPADRTSEEGLELFDMAANAARKEGNRQGEIDVLLAKASFLVAVENYPQGLSILRLVTSRLENWEQDGNGDSLSAKATAIRYARAKRKVAEAYLQMGSYALAKEALEEAAGAAEQSSSQEQRLLQLLWAENHHVPSPEPTYGDILDGNLNDPVYFRALLVRSEENRRRQYWDDAEKDLLTVEQHSMGDVRRIASVQYRLARLYIGQWRHNMPHQGLPVAGEVVELPHGELRCNDLRVKAVLRAAQAVLAFRRMGNPIGVIRAQCQQIRALVIAGQLLAAEQLLHTVRQSLRSKDITSSPAFPGLRARLLRAYGEFLVHRGDIGTAWRTLTDAAAWYEQQQDWACHADIWELLDVVQLLHPHTATAGTHLVDMSGVTDKDVTPERVSLAPGTDSTYYVPPQSRGNVSEPPRPPDDGPDDGPVPARARKV